MTCHPCTLWKWPRVLWQKEIEIYNGQSLLLLFSWLCNLLGTCVDMPVDIYNLHQNWYWPRRVHETAFIRNVRNITILVIRTILLFWDIGYYCKHLRGNGDTWITILFVWFSLNELVSICPLLKITWTRTGSSEAVGTVLAHDIAPEICCAWIARSDSQDDVIEIVR